MNREAFARIEQKLFTKRMLSAPVCVAQVRCIVRYTSPKGQNSYFKELRWNFEELRSGLTEMKQIQKAQSTATFLRQRTQPHEHQPSIPGPLEGQLALHELRSDATDARCQPPCRSHCPREQRWKD